MNGYLQQHAGIMVGDNYTVHSGAYIYTFIVLTTFILCTNQNDLKLIKFCILRDPTVTEMTKFRWSNKLEKHMTVYTTRQTLNYRLNDYAWFIAFWKKKTNKQTKNLSILNNSRKYIRNFLFLHLHSTGTKYAESGKDLDRNITKFKCFLENRWSSFLLIY